MKPTKEERNLDERIRCAIGREEVTFDFDKWKAGHQNQIERFKASVSKESIEPAHLSPWLIIAKSRLTKFAAAAVLIVAIGILLYPKERSRLVEVPRTARVEKAPAELLTAMSLDLAYRRGGMETLDEQFDEALRRLGPRPSHIMLSQLLTEFNGG